MYLRKIREKPVQTVDDLVQVWCEETFFFSFMLPPRGTVGCGLIPANI